MFWISLLFWTSYVRSSSPISSDPIREVLSCWTDPNGTWVTDLHPFYTPYRDPTGQWKEYKPSHCPPDPTPYKWKPSNCPLKFSSSWNVKQICSTMNGRPLVFIGDSLMFYSYISFIIMMADRRPFEIASDGTTTSFHFETVNAFAKYPPRTLFLNFSEACEEVNEKPFILFMNNRQYLDLNPIFHNWLENHSNAIMFINRGYHYAPTSKLRDQLIGMLNDYILRIDSKAGGAVIWRSIHMPHPSCQNYQHSVPFTSQNYSLYETKGIIQSLKSTYNWYEIIQQDKEFIRPLFDQLIRENLHNSKEKLFYLDIISSSKFQVRRHTADCLHYCISGPMDSWLVFLLNTIRLIDQKRRHYHNQHGHL